MYDVEQITVTPYHDSSDSSKQLPPVTASAFYIPWELVPKVVDGKEQLPGDRYIRIITAGVSATSFSNVLVKLAGLEHT